MMVVQNTLKKAYTYNPAQLEAKDQLEFDFKIYEVSLMEHYSSYLKKLKSNEGNLFAHIGILTEARALVDTGVLTLENPDSDEVMVVDVMKRYRDLESGATSCNVEGCSACSIFSANNCQECSEELALNKETGQCDGCVAHLYSEPKLEDIGAGW